jgi:hypothetical protein
MNRLHKLLLAMILVGTALGSALAQPASKDQIKGLDEQVQDIKKDVLAISSELLQLEEKLLYPSNTQVSLFVSLPAGSKLQVDSLKIRLDGKDAAHHIYTYKEVEALRSGGIQRVHTDNLRTGDHTLEVTLVGKTGGTAEYRQVASHAFKKSVEPKLVEIILNGPDAANPPIQFSE